LKLKRYLLDFSYFFARNADIAKKGMAGFLLMQISYENMKAFQYSLGRSVFSARKSHQANRQDI